MWVNRIKDENVSEKSKKKKKKHGKKQTKRSLTGCGVQKGPDRHVKSVCQSSSLEFWDQGKF